MTNILNEFWNEIKGKKNKSLEGKIFNWLNKDNLGTIIVEGGVFWTETTNSTVKIPNYIHDYIVKWGERRGLKWWCPVTC